jgi:DNA invertase Pin-like site-specific DNA recombinase
MKVVLYARASSERQAEKDLSIPAQQKQMRLFCEAGGHAIVDEFVDAAESARTANRPEFQRMIAEAKKKGFSAIIVWKLSRFARSREDSILYKRLLSKLGVQVISINEPVDESATGRFLEGFIELADEFYSDNLAEDTLRGMRENASRGCFTGGTPPLGYIPYETENHRRRLKIDPRFGPVVQEIFRLASEGLGAKEIATGLNDSGLRTRRGKLWSKNTILYTLRSEIYTGTYVWNRKKSRPQQRNPTDEVRVPGAVPLLISQEVFDAVQLQINARRPSVSHPRTTASRYLLAGLLRCGLCDRVMQGPSVTYQQIDA